MLVEFLLLFLFIKITIGSEGDESAQFQVCLMHCIEDTSSPSSAKALSFPLRLFRWNCEDECKYQCMWETIDNNRSFPLLYTKDPIQKYYGKWPFLRFFGMQEPASVIFSLLNAAAHVVGWIYLLHPALQQRPAYWMSDCYWRYFWTGILVWMCSATFHSRDTWVTEKMDYFAAAWSIFVWFHLTVCRCWPVVRKSSQSIFLAIVSGCFALHVVKMLFHNFDYRYNLVVLCSLGLITQGMWLYWVNGQSQLSASKQLSSVKIIPWTIVFFTLSTAVLEVGDFAPIWGIFDSHSLWHLSTVPITLMWYYFFADDVRNGHQPLID